MNTVIPKWIIQAVVTTVIGVIVTGFSAWGVNLSHRSSNHETRIAVIEDHQKGIDKSLDEIKAMQREQGEDTKKILRHLTKGRQ